MAAKKKKAAAKKRPKKAKPKKAKPKKGLHDAARFGDLERVEELLRDGADVHEKKDGLTPLHWAAFDAMVPDPKAELHLAIVRALLDAGAEVDAPSDGAGITPLFFAAGNENEAMVRLLVERGASVAAVAVDGEGILSRAVRDAPVPAPNAGHAQSADIVRVLCELGADPNVRDDEGLTAILHAAGAGDAGKTRSLLAHGADPSAKTPEGIGLLHMASTGGLVDVVRDLLARGHSAADTTTDGLTPLHYAASSVGAREGCPAVVRLLVAQGADPDARTHDGRTPADFAFDRAEYEAVLASAREGTS